MLENNYLFSFLQKHKVRISVIAAYIGLLAAMLWIPPLMRFVPKNSQSLNIIIFPEVVSIEMLRGFTEETGITVHARHVEGDAEMCTYLNDENNAYDAVCIPEYLIPELERTKIVSPLSKSLIPNYQKLHPMFKTENPEPTSIPFSWALFGLGVDTKQLPFPGIPSWSIIFQPLPYKICVSDDPRSLILMGALGLGFSTETLTKKELFAICAELAKQKQHVELYSDTNIALLFANRIVPLAFASYQSVALANKYNPDAKFIIPQEGAVRIAQNWIIPTNSTKKELAHSLINYMLSTKVSTILKEDTEFLPTNRKKLEEYWTDTEQNSSNCPLPSEEIIKNAHLAPSNLSPKLLSSFWITLKNT
jgi:spermidine/putrescine-binding protein